MPTLPVYCNHYTLGNSKKVIFQQHYSYRFKIIMLSQKKQTATACTAAYLTYCCLLLPIICVDLFYGQFFYLSGQSFSKPPMPTHNRLFSKVTNIWRNATLPAVRCKSFTFYKVVWLHISCVVGKEVTVFFLRIHK